MTTNREKINKMSNEELAEILAYSQDGCNYCSYGDNTHCNANSIQCAQKILQWLKSEIKE
jgi:hypothetical protein